MYIIIFFISVIFSIFILLNMQNKLYRRLTIFDPGILFVSLFAACYLLPSLAILFFGEIDDTGLLLSNDSANRVSLYGVLFIWAFTISYLSIGRGSRSRIGVRQSNIELPSLNSCVILYVVLFLASRITLAQFGASGAESDDYSLQYLVRSQMPSLVSQALNISRNLQFVLIYLILSYCFSLDTNRVLQWPLVTIGGLLVVEMLVTKSRATFVIFLLLYFGARAFYGKSVGIKWEIFITFLVVLAMNTFAIMRSGDSSFGDASVASIPSEFMSIYRNAVHLISIEGTGEFVNTPGVSYFQSIISFIPKQLYEDKWDLNLWYVTEYFPEYLAEGGGAAFGIIPEAIVNFGLISIVFQAIVIAFVIRVGSLMAYRYSLNRPNLWVLYYLLCFGFIYPMIRSDSFALIGSLFYGFFIPLLIIYLLLKVGILRQSAGFPYSSTRKSA